MRIRIVADNKVFGGTPTDIVKRMRDTNHETYASLDDYIQDCRLRLKDLLGEVIETTGRTEDERCQAFLQTLVEKGYAKLEVDSPEDVDRFAIALLRSILGLSQERLAHEIGVTFGTVNRWERGKTRPSSAAISDRIGRIAEKVVH